LDKVKLTNHYVIDSATERLYKLEEVAGVIRTFFTNQMNEA